MHFCQLQTRPRQLVKDWWKTQEKFPVIGVMYDLVCILIFLSCCKNIKLFHGKNTNMLEWLKRQKKWMNERHCMCWGVGVGGCNKKGSVISHIPRTTHTNTNIYGSRTYTADVYKVAKECVLSQWFKTSLRRAWSHRRMYNLIDGCTELHKRIKSQRLRLHRGMNKVSAGGTMLPLHVSP